MDFLIWKDFIVENDIFLFSPIDIFVLHPYSEEAFQPLGLYPIGYDFIEDYGQVEEINLS